MKCSSFLQKSSPLSQGKSTLAQAVHCLQPLDHAARQQSRIAYTTIMVIEFH
jgi:hypothetical protein